MVVGNADRVFGELRHVCRVPPLKVVGLIVEIICILAENHQAARENMRCNIGQMGLLTCSPISRQISSQPGSTAVPYTCRGCLVVQNDPLEPHHHHCHDSVECTMR